MNKGLKQQMDPETTARLNDYLGDFVHDCRNRIGSLKLTLHVLERKGDPAMQSIIDDLRQQITDLNQLVESVRDVPVN